MDNEEHPYRAKKDNNTKEVVRRLGKYPRLR